MISHAKQFVFERRYLASNWESTQNLFSLSIDIELLALMVEPTSANTESCQFFIHRVSHKSFQFVKSTTGGHLNRLKFIINTWGNLVIAIFFVSLVNFYNWDNTTCYYHQATLLSQILEGIHPKKLSSVCLVSPGWVVKVSKTHYKLLK